MYLDRGRVARIDLDEKRGVPAQDEIDTKDPNEAEARREHPADRLDLALGGLAEPPGTYAPAIGERVAGLAVKLPADSNERGPGSISDEERRAA